jgi:hypothetical protein
VSLALIAIAAGLAVIWAVVAIGIGSTQDKAAPKTATPVTRETPQVEQLKQSPQSEKLGSGNETH